MLLNGLIHHGIWAHWCASGSKSLAIKINWLCAHSAMGNEIPINFTKGENESILRFPDQVEDEFSQKINNLWKIHSGGFNEFTSN